MDLNDLSIAEWQRLVGDRIAERRQERFGPSRQEAARRAGIPESTLRQAEHGFRIIDSGQEWPSRPDAATRRKIAVALGWPVDFAERLVAGETPEAFA